MKLFKTTAILLALCASAAQAQDFPTKTVTIVIPYGGGGSTDLIGRQLAHELSKLWDQPVVIENRPGAGSMIGAAYLSQAAPDGYTLMVNTAAQATAPVIQKDLPFDPKTDITAIGMVATSPYMAVAGAAVKATNFEEFIAEAKERPMFFSTAGLGSSSHFTAELLMRQAELPGDVVHFAGGGEAQTNLMGGHADIYISTTASVMPYVNNGQVKPIVILGPERYDLLPDVQSSGEVGISGIDINGWVGLFGPGGMDKALVDKLNTDMHTALATPDFQELLKNNFVEAGTDTAEEFKTQVDDEMAIWSSLAEERGISQ